MLVPLHPAVFLEVVVELLDLDGGQLVQLDVAQLGNDVLVDVVQVIIFGFLSEPRFGVDLIPQFDPSLDRVGIFPTI